MASKRKKTSKRPCEICGTVTFLATHHIRGRKIHNPNHRSNLVDICHNCHSEIHHGDIIVEGWVQTTDGKELLWHKHHEESLTGDDAKVHIFGEKN